VPKTNVDLSPIRAGRLALAGLLAAALLLAAAVSVATDPAAAALKFKQPTCGKFQKQVKKSIGAKKRAAKAQLKQCKADAAVYRQVRDSHFVGERTDGVEIDTIYCANGKWQDDVAAGGDVGTSGWRIIDAKINKAGTKFTGTIEAWIPGGRHVQGVIRDGASWKIGWEFSGKINAAGPVEKRDARAACAGF
jgi:hypothetical protein